MANEQYAFLDKNKMVNLADWQETVTESGFDLQVHPDLKIGEDSGFVPCKLYGTDSGVEIDFVDNPEYLADFKDVAPDATYYVSFRWGGDMAECACAMILSYALAKRAGAFVTYECEHHYNDLDVLKSETMHILRDAKLIPKG